MMPAKNDLRKLKGLKASLDVSVDESRALRRLAMDLNGGCEELDGLKFSAEEVHQRVLSAVRLQGQRLQRAKELVGHGKFLVWLERNCARIHRKTASNWMRAAAWVDANVQAVAHLRSVSQVYLLAGIIPEPDQPDVRTEPAFSLALAMETALKEANRLTKPLERLSVEAVLALPAPEQQQLKAALRPNYERLQVIYAALPDPPPGKESIHAA